MLRYTVIAGPQSAAMGALHRSTLVLLLLLLASVVPALGFNISPQFSSEAGAPKARRRWLRGPGSWPPTCRYNCGSCAPCRAVQVPIHPGRTAVPMEYYPEAWRCKCGNKLFMP